MTFLEDFKRANDTNIIEIIIKEKHPYFGDTNHKLPIIIQ